jgi:alpha-L-fucosidase
MAAEAVYTSKRREDSESGTCVLDLERGLVDKIWPAPWQTDTCVGGWHYNKGIKYKDAKTVIDMLVDIVSRNGNLLLNFPLNSAGVLDEDEQKTLAGITGWMAINSEGIYATRPWKVFGGGPGTADSAKGTGFNENNRKALTAEDWRFTTKGQILYAFCMGVPETQAVIPLLARGGAHRNGQVQNVELLGARDKVNWTQDETALTIQMPDSRPFEHAVTFKIAGL